MDELYRRVCDVHLADIRTFRGAFIRIRLLMLRRIPSGLFSLLALVCGWLIWLIKGKRYEYDVILESLKDSKDDIRMTSATPPPAESIDFFGYRVSIWTLFTYSTFALILLSASSRVLDNVIPKNSQVAGLMTVSLAIVTIVLYDMLLPRTLKLMTKYASVRCYNLKYKGIKLSV